jgi:putative ABC transport system permease protein
VPGTLIGWVSALWAVRAMVSWIPQDYLQRGGHVTINLRAAAVAVALCGITALVTGLIPAFFTKTDVSAALAHSTRMTAGSGLQRRVRRALVIAEVTMAFVLVFGAGLFLNSFLRLRSAPLGFEANDRLVVSISLSGDRYASADSIIAFTSRLLATARALPGVADASVGTSLPLGSGPGIIFWRAEAPRPSASEIRGLVRAIGPTYFDTFGMSLIAGRSFTDRDAIGAPMVAVINRTLAERHFAGENPIGRQIVVAPRRSTPWLGTHRVEVVGVVENSKDIDLHEVAFSSVYLPFAQHPASSMQLVVRTSAPAATSIASVRGAVLAVDSELPVVGVGTMASRVDAALKPNRFNMLLLTAFAGIAVVLAAVGLYGAMSYAIQQRIPELGLRLALGARSIQLLASTLGDSLRLGVAGTVLGLGVCLALSRAIGDALYLVQGRSLGVIYGVTTTDPLTLVCAAAAVLCLALLAGIIPARRAMQIDPALALKSD